jgi:hypothetical protein
VFIAFRAGIVGRDFDYYVHGKPVDFSTMPYATTDQTRHELQSTDIVAEIRKRLRTSRPPPTSTGPNGPTRSSGC